MAARTGRPYKLQVLSTNGERKLQGSANNPTEFIRELCVFIDFLRKRRSTTRVLLTSRPQAEIREILGRLPSIEYDMERKGLICLVSYSPDKHGN